MLLIRMMVPWRPFLSLLSGSAVTQGPIYKGMSIELDRHEIAPGVCRLWRDCLTLLEWIR